MAIALIGSASASLSGGGASGSTFLDATSGQLLVAVYAVASTADRALTISSASGGTWNLVASELYANDTYDTNLRVAWKFADAVGLDNTVNYSSNAVSGEAGAALVFAFSGVSQSSPLDVTPVSASGFNGGQPNPGAITPATTGSIVLVLGAAALNSVSDLVPTGLSDTISRQGPASTNRIVVAGGTSAWTSGALDPAAWTGGGGASAAASWAAVTLALRPVATTDASGALPTLTVAAPIATGKGGAAAAAALPAVSITAPSASIVGRASASAVLPDVAFSAPTGTVGEAAVAAGALADLTMTAPTVVVSSAASVAGNLPSLTVTAPIATATAYTLADGPLPGFTLAPPFASAGIAIIVPPSRRFQIATSNAGSRRFQITG